MLGASKQTFAFDGKDWTLTLDMDVISAFEEEAGYSVIDVVTPPGGGNPMISRLHRLLAAALAPAHAGVPRDVTSRMMGCQDALTALLRAVKASLPVASDDPDGETGNGNRAQRRAAKSRQPDGKTG